MYHFLMCLLDPVLLLFLLAAIVLAAAWRNRSLRRGRLTWATLAFVGLAGLCTRLLSFLALGSCEWPYPPASARPEGVSAIVVLAGNIRPPVKVLPKGELGDRTLYRCLHAARLYREGPPCLVVVCGGSDGSSLVSAAQMMREFLVEQGVAQADVLLEDRSTTTYENAVETRILLDQRGIQQIVLVTDARHLLRADRCFSAQGFEVTPVGCDYRATQFPAGLLDCLPSAGAAVEMRDVLREWLGLIWYRLRGRI